MNSYSIVQFIAFGVYAILLALVIRHARTRVRFLFVVYLVASMAWSLSSFLAHADFTAGNSGLWFKLVPFCALWTVIAYSHFISGYVRNRSGVISGLGYGLLSVVALLIALGYIPQNTAGTGGGGVVNDYGAWIYLLTFGGACFTGTAVFMLVKSYRSSRSPEQRNRIFYLLAGVGFLVVFGSLFEAIPVQKYAPDHIGHLGNALVLSYAILRYQLLDIKLIIRKGLIYSGVTICITATYLVILAVLQHLLHGWSSTAGLGAIVIVAVLMAWMFNPLRKAVQKAADRLFYGERYDYRQLVLSFARRMSNVLDIEELAEAMLRPITRAVRARQASLLLLHNGDFITQFVEGIIEGGPVVAIRLTKDSPIVKWLDREDKPLSREAIDIKPEFKGLWEVERRALNKAEIALFCPIKSKQRLVAVLAVGRKQPRGFYSSDDIDLFMTVAQEAAVTIENAQLYAQARKRANTDELTGLYNHRYFHERLDEEISRCSRFGHVFSLLFLGLDLFKAYNDIHGHVAGDDILRQVGEHIKLETRNMDVAVRYGGDEFAIILPQTSVADARKVAERLRKRVEIQTESQGVPLTCSSGIASWPADGVMREEIVRVADAALYYAKQTGRNRICVGSEVVLSEVLKMEIRPENSNAILSTIYALAATVDAKDHYTYGHSKKVAKYATDIAEALGYSEEKLAVIRAAALLHDIGKIGISDRLLEKTGPLGPEEWGPIRAHPNLGVAILKHIEGLKGCLAAVQYHHERYDGTGYPTGLAGHSIPIDARILAVADAYDAMTSLRPYRRASFTHEQALEELIRNAGSQFDPEMVNVFTSLYSEPPLATIEEEPGLAAGVSRHERRGR